MRVVLAVLILVMGATEAFAQRVALVIGNGAYREAPALPNPVADARGVAAALERLGFRADLVLDADRTAMESAIRRFGEAAAGAEAALVYYAGHAVEVAGRNHLIPVSARIRSDRDLPFETIDFDAVMAQLEGRARVILVFLDACRDNPFRQRLMAGGTRGVAAVGLAPVRGPVGTLVAFATAPGQVASDGYGPNSPFTAALLQHIETPGLEVRPMLGRVRQSVREATAGSQVPWENSSLEGEFFFRPAAAPQTLAALPAREPPAAPPAASRSGASPDGAAELLFWESVKDSRSIEELQAYLRRFPDGVFSDLARARISALERAARPAAPAAAASAPASAAQPPPAPAPTPPPPPAREAARPAPVAPPPPSPSPPAPSPPDSAAPVQPQRQAAVRPPPAPPTPAPPPQGYPGRGETIRVLTHQVPLPAGPWREAARWVEQSNPTLGTGFRQIFPVHTVILVQEREGRVIAAMRVTATDNGGEITGWSAPSACRAEGSLARGLVSTAGLFLDCWQVRRRPATETAFVRQLGEGVVVSSLHAAGDSRNMMEVEYAFTYATPERVAAWAPAAQAAISRGFLGRSRLAEGLAAP
ncbi:MAG: caspase family protein [Acetobacteraceae bacterium]|jgi:uncharacterized caspase-like protein|nr:caspase family protein [Acetobacteraceae bacterium]